MLNRRDFLAAGSGLALAGLTVPGWGRDARTTGRLRFAPERGLFERTVGPDIDSQMEFAAAVGFDAFVEGPLLRQPIEEARNTLDLARRHGLLLGPAWGPSLSRRLLADPDGLAETTLALVRARELGISGVRFEVGPVVTQALLAQPPAARELLLVMAELASKHQIAAILEPWDDGRVGAMTYDAWAEWVADTAAPDLGMTADTWRLSAAGYDVETWLTNHRALIRHVELADLPTTSASPGTRMAWSRVAAALGEPTSDVMIGLRYAPLSHHSPSGDRPLA